jgi:hypothetical protein
MESDWALRYENGLYPFSQKKKKKNTASCVHIGMVYCTKKKV